MVCVFVSILSIGIIPWSVIIGVFAVKQILEIGASSGDGSTEAFAIGILSNPSLPTLYTLEVSKTRFDALKNRYKNNSNILCYNLSSVDLLDFPTKSEVEKFFKELNKYPVHVVLGWLDQDINYIKKFNIPCSGIKKIKCENNIDYFDLVLIDGSEFTGKVELNLVYGAKHILLDDICTFKNYYNYMRLLNDENYELKKSNLSLRNGYAYFSRKDSNN